jgi:hypothetical protein
VGVAFTHLLQMWRRLLRSHAQPLAELYASHVTELSLVDTCGEDGDIARLPWLVLERCYGSSCGCMTACAALLG